MVVVIYYLHMAQLISTILKIVCTLSHSRILCVDFSLCHIESFFVILSINCESSCYVYLPELLSFKKVILIQSFIAVGSLISAFIDKNVDQLEAKDSIEFPSGLANLGFIEKQTVNLSISYFIIFIKYYLRIFFKNL